MSDSVYLPHNACRLAVRELGPQLLGMIDDISELRPRLEGILGGVLLDQLPEGDLAKTEQAVIMSGFVRQAISSIVDGTGVDAHFIRNSSFYIESPPHVLGQSRPTRDYVCSDGLYDIIHNSTKQYFFNDERWVPVNDRYHALYRKRREAGHATEVTSMLQIIPPEDYTSGVTALVRLIDENPSVQHKPARERLKITHDVVYLLGSKASMHANLEAASCKVDTLKGDVVDIGGSSVFRSTDAELWHSVFPSGLPDGIVTKCFVHQLFAGQDETDMMTFVHAGINYASEYNLFNDPI